MSSLLQASERVTRLGEAKLLSVAFVLPYGEPDPGFFPDTLMGLMGAAARRVGHQAHLVRVYYHGSDDLRDAEVRGRLLRWLDERDVDLIVIERLFDPEPIRAHLAAAPGRRAALVSWGDANPLPGIDLVIGLTPGAARSGRTRRSPSAGELVRSFEGLLAALAAGGDPAAVPGVALVDGGHTLAAGPAPVNAPLPRPFAPALDHDVICLGEPPVIRRRFLFGNAGCPFAADPAQNPHYADVHYPDTVNLALLGCSFCHAGGDYQKRTDDEVIVSLLEQARYFQEHVPEVEELVIVDQHPLRYLAALVRGAHEEGLRPTRWLFQARADSFVREFDRIRQAVVAAAAGHVIEVFLIGFESFCDRELARYNKGVTAAELSDAVNQMRELRREYPDRFEYASGRGHSLILWSPWTTPDDLQQSIDHVRGHGLAELFSELGRNRLRLYADLPIYYAAERDGALVGQWQEGDEGAGRRKGYSLEKAWRFLDPRTRLAYTLAVALRDRLGRATEVAQLAAVVEYVQRDASETGDPVAQRARVLASIHAVDGRLSALPQQPVGGRAILWTGPCNNGCRACPNRHAWTDDREQALAGRVDSARQQPGTIVLAGREPTLHPAFLRLVQRAAGDDGRSVAVVSNGRRFAYGEYARAAVAAGLRAASIKLFAPDAETADAIARDSGAFAQALAGVAELGRAGAAVEVCAPLHRDNLDRYEQYAALAQRLGAHRLRVELALDALGLDCLDAATGAIDRLDAACKRLGIAVCASPLEAGTAWF